MKQFPFFGILGLLFVALKLTGFIAWSWWLVLAPIWGPALFVILLLLIAGGVMLAVGD
jgi:hypothetical protein